FNLGRLCNLAVFENESEGEGNVQRLLGTLPWRCRNGLFQRQREGGRARVIGGGGADERCTGLHIPAEELAEIAAACILEALDEILNRRGFTIVALEIEIHALTEILRTQNGGDHAGDLGTLLIDGRRIEVVDFAVFIRPWRMRERTAIFRELL